MDRPGANQYRTRPPRVTAADIRLARRNAQPRTCKNCQQRTQPGEHLLADGLCRYCHTVRHAHSMCCKIYGGGCIIRVYPPSWAHEQGDPTNCVLAAGQAQDPASLRVAFSSPHDRVRWAAASNPCLPVDLLRRLLQDPDPDVARAAADNPGTPRPLRAMWQLTQ